MLDVRRDCDNSCPVRVVATMLDDSTMGSGRRGRHWFMLERHWPLPEGARGRGDGPAQRSGRGASAGA